MLYCPAVSGPHREQWLRASDSELIKLVDTSRTLCPVHFATSNPTYYNPVAKEKWSPSSLLLPGSAGTLWASDVRSAAGKAGARMYSLA